jgi:aminoglycoside phosphotransferase (APT) family kinase protein
MEPGEEGAARLEGGAGMSSAEAFTGTTPVREGFALDLPALTAWMEVNVAEYRGTLTVEQFKGGQSNPTYRLRTPERDYVLRRKPPGQLLAGAHAVEREARVLTALGSAGYPVPRVHALCTDDAVIGSWFYVMDMVEGRIFWDAALAELPCTERGAIYEAMNDAVAQLHAVDYAAIGLGDYGRPENYAQRQIARWTRQYREDADAGRDANMDALIDWLEANVPASAGISIVHGDLRIDNLIFAPDEPRVAAVLDWELSTLGDPLADFAYNAMMYRMPPYIVAGLGGSDPAVLGLPSEAEYIMRYCRSTGRDGIADYAFYQAFVFFRLAAIFHGIKGRVIRGTASSAQAAERARYFPELAAIGLSLTGRR